MRLLFTSNAKTKVIRGGQSFVDECPECGHRATFDEVEITESYGVFFVDVVSDTQRAFRCSRCGDTFDLKDVEAPAAKPAPVARPVAPAKSATELAREREAKANQIDDELAELKRRMGR